MIHLITVTGSSARSFYLRKESISDFKALMRTVTSGRILIISTQFRSDLFYKSEAPKHESLLKLWALHANHHLSDLGENDYQTYEGNENSLSHYFQAINEISAHWYQYKFYQEAFEHAYHNDPQNPMAQTIVQCDLHLVQHPSIKREPLIRLQEKTDKKLIKDTFSLAMNILNHNPSN